MLTILAVVITGFFAVLLFSVLPLLWGEHDEQQHAPFLYMDTTYSDGFGGVYRRENGRTFAEYVRLHVRKD